ASSSAIYGSRAASGVVLITTKKGKPGSPAFVFSTTLGDQTLAKQESVLSAAQFRSYVNANGTPAQIAMMGSANTNWQDQIYQTALGSTNNLSISGGLKKLPYRISIGYQD